MLWLKLNHHQGRENDDTGNTENETWTHVSNTGLFGYVFYECNRYSGSFCSRPVQIFLSSRTR
jgi:hypothetical protein